MGLTSDELRGCTVADFQGVIRMPGIPKFRL
jgi:hypothetical protein